MSISTALPLLYGLCDEWTSRGQMLAALGGDPGHLADALHPTPATPVDRAEQIAAFTAAI